jgi:hypothetical protein
VLGAECEVDAAFSREDQTAHHDQFADGAAFGGGVFQLFVLVEAYHSTKLEVQGVQALGFIADVTTALQQLQTDIPLTGKPESDNAHV